MRAHIKKYFPGLNLKNSFQHKLLFFLSSIVTVFVVIISIFTYSYFNMNVLNEVNNSISRILEQSNLVLENNLDNTIEKTTQLLFEENIKNYIYYNENLADNAEYLGMAVKIKENANLIKDSSGLIDSVYVYFSSSDKIIADSGSYNKKDFYEHSFIDEIQSEIIKNPSNSFLTRIRYYDYDKKMYYKKTYSNRIVSFIHPIFNDYTRGFIVVNIKSDVLLNASSGNAESMASGFGNIAILDNNRELIYPEKLGDWKDDSLTASFKTLQKNKSNGFYTEKGNNEKYLVLYSSDNKYGWKQVLCLPFSIIYKNIYIFRNVLIAMTVSIILLGIVLSYFCSVFLYKPIKAIYNSVVNSKSGIYPNSSNELVTIKNYISNLSSESEEIREKLSKNLPALKEVFIHELLMGRISDPETFKSKCDNYNLFEEKEGFAVFIVLFDDWNRLSSEYKENEQNLFKFAIFDCAANISGGDTSGIYLLCEPNKVILLKGLPKFDDTEVINLEMEQLAAEIQKGVMSNLGQSVTISIGLIANQYRNLAYSYSSAMEALNYRLIYGNGCTINASRINSINTENYAYPYEKEKLLLIYLSNLSRDKVEPTIESIYDPEFIGHFSYKFVEQMTIHLLNTLHKFMIDSNLKMHDLFGDTNLYNQLAQKETVSEIKAGFKSICDVIICNLEQKKGSKGKNIAENALVYIEQNYNKDINLEIAAEYFKISRQHFSKTFQDYYGTGFNDYLNDYRLEKARKLLEESDLKLKDICSMIGISNPQYFIKLFKGKYFTTPSEYRKNSVQ